MRGYLEMSKPKGKGMNSRVLLFVFAFSLMLSVYNITLFFSPGLPVHALYVLLLFPMLFVAPRLSPVILLTCAFYVYMSSLNLSMVQLDSKKFYAEAFQGGYSTGVIFSTVDSTGVIYRIYSDMLGSVDPSFLVTINMLLHYGVVLFSLASINIICFKENIFIAIPLLLSPLILEYSPYLMKDFFVVFCHCGAVYFLIRWKVFKEWLSFAFLIMFVIAASLFRLYAILYLLAFWILMFSKVRWSIFIVLGFTVSLVAFFGLKTVLFIIYSFLAIFFIPNFLSISSIMDKPLVCLEGGVYFFLWFYVALMTIKRKDWKGLSSLLLGFLFIACIYAFTSLYRIELTSYESTGGYLTDNFLRKKLPVFFILYVVLIARFHHEKFLAWRRLMVR